MNKKLLVILLCAVLVTCLVFVLSKIYISRLPIVEESPGVPSAPASERMKIVSPEDKYKLFWVYEDQLPYFQVSYIDDGLIQAGKYKGYHLLYASIPGEIGDPDTQVFATKDYKEFTLGTALEKPDFKYVTDAYTKGDIYNKEKVVGIDDFSVNHPRTIKIGNQVLERDNLWIVNDPVVKATTYSELPSNIPGLTYLVEKYDNGVTSLLEVNSYIGDSTRILVKDAKGIIFSYKISINLKKSDIISSTNLYDSYGGLLPGGCGDNGYSFVIKNITDSDLEKIAQTKVGVDLYIIKDLNNPLYKAEFDRKITDMADTGVFNPEVSKIKQPTYVEYMRKMPILVFKDPWGRLIGIGESYYEGSYGCGKPAIYLYPTLPTKVNISFTEPVQFGVNIPTYKNGWSVLARPDGTLEDLQRDATDCDAIDYSQFGSEYAKEPCKEGVYPYIYWNGNVSNPYPREDKGWIVLRGDLKSFLGEKLEMIGLNSTERNDMISYWVPEMLAKNTFYYRVSFIQTKEMNKFIPMVVYPRPDTTLRIFLDWEPLLQKPTKNIEPQILEKASRNGFTLVEWGGVHP